MLDTAFKGSPKSMMLMMMRRGGHLVDQQGYQLKIQSFINSGRECVSESIASYIQIGAKLNLAIKTLTSEPHP